MNNQLQNYFIKTSLNIRGLSEDKDFSHDLFKVLNEQSVDSGIENKLSYQVPKLGPNGSCSLADELEEKPYDLKKVFDLNQIPKISYQLLISRLDKAVELFRHDSSVDWIGIYKKFKTSSGWCLVKLAYRGLPSRAEFPLTAEFATHSNNSTVGLSGKAVLVNSVSQHIQEGKPYYECDVKVQSELCLPVFGADGSIIGIIDAESFQENFFDNQKIAKVALLALGLSGLDNF